MGSTDTGEHWGIIGGGIMGLTLALRLARLGRRVTILEASPAPGGLTRDVDRKGITWDAFYHVILLSDLRTRALLNEVGLKDEVEWVESKTGFYSDKQLYSMSSIMEYFRFPPLTLAGKFRLGVTIALATMIRNWKRMEGIPVEVWLRRWSGKKVFSRIWLPLLRAKLGEHFKETSAIFIWATIQRMYAARRSGLKKEKFGYVRGGYEKAISALTGHLAGMGVEVQCSMPVEAVRKDPSGKLKVHFGNGERLVFDRVISTLPSDLSVSLAPGMSQDEISLHRGIRYLGVICPSVLLSKPVSEYYITNIISPETPFTGIIEMTALVDPSELGGHHLVYLPKYVVPEDELFQKTGPELKEYFLNALLEMYPGLSEKDVVHWSVAKAKRVFALPTLHYSENLPQVVTSLEGYYIVNSAQIIDGTLNVNETIRIADSKLDEILKNSEPYQ